MRARERQVVGAGPRPPGLGRNWAQTEAQGGWWGPGPAAGGGAAASRGYFLAKKVSALESSSGPFQGQLNRVMVVMQVSGFVGRQIDCWRTS